MRVAIMQPYFMPYAGYFRLMAAADLFVIYDCVQFPRRGWVHRNKLTHKGGSPEWLTLPLAKADRETTRIIDLQFAEGAQSEWEQRMAEFPVLSGTDSPLLSQVKALKGTPCEYIVSGMHMVCDMLGLTCRFAASSALNLPLSIKGQARILSIASHFGATTYINASGGRELYQEDAFADKGIQLKFLPDYTGKFASVLERLLTEPAAEVAKEIRDNL